VQAIQWTGDNEAEVRELAGGAFGAVSDPGDDPDVTAELLTTRHSVWELIYTGDWIIMAPDGDLFCATDDEFQRVYVPWRPVIERVAEIVGVPVADLKVGLARCPHEIATVFGYDPAEQS
jgi:hypothetical protein